MTLAFCLWLATWAVAASEVRAGRVVHVVDGDTLDVLLRDKVVRIRLAEIDAPEQNQPYGHRSRQSLIQICAGEVAQLEISGRDRNKRSVARVICNGTDANTEQVRLGMAWVFDRYAAATSPLYAAQSEARAARRGLWSASNAREPWKWRAERAGSR